MCTSYSIHLKACIRQTCPLHTLNLPLSATAMKFLDMPELSRLAQALSHEGPECSIHTRLKVYSCKDIKHDKKLFKSLEMTYKEVSNSPLLPSFLADLDLGRK